MAQGLWLATAALYATALVLALFEEPSEAILGLFVGLPIGMYGTLGALVARRRPQNPIGWLFCAVAASLALWWFGQAYAFTGGTDVTVGGLPGAAPLLWLGVLSPVAVLCVALPAFLLVFPEGHLRSPRWRIAVAGAGLGGVLATLGMAVTIHRYTGRRLLPPGWVEGIPSVGGFLAAGLLLAAGAALAGLLSLAARFRESEGDRRHQLRLLLWMLVAMAVAPSFAFLGWFGLAFMFLVDGFGMLIGIPAATAVAVLTFGLYDVGVVVKKTIVYGLIVLFITIFTALMVYLVAPAGLLGVQGNTTSGQAAVVRIVGGLTFVALTIAATWRLTRRVARRIVYGKRATPYEALSEFSDRLGGTYSTEDVLPRMAVLLRSATGAETARIWLLVGGELRPEASAPHDAAAASPLRLGGEELPELPGSVLPVRHHGELLGAITLEMPRSEPLSKTGQRLVADFSAQAGLVLRNVRLTEELRSTIEQLRESRRRIVAAQDARAKKLERDLHDGAQQQLVSLSVKLRLVEHLAVSDGEGAAALIAELHQSAKDALESLRDLARGIYPPLLAEEGLAAAVEAQARKSPIPVTIEAAGIARHAPEVEAAVYYCCLEALNNAAKYANASNVTVRLSRRADDLVFEVADDGTGFDLNETGFGTGLQGMEDRLAALGGALEVRSAPGSGTTVTGRILTGASETDL